MYEFMIPQGQPKPVATVDGAGKIVEDGADGGKEIPLEKFSMGQLKGFVMALEGYKTQGVTLQFRDQLKIKCSGRQEQTGLSKSGAAKDDMIEFELELTR